MKDSWLGDSPLCWRTANFTLVKHKEGEKPSAYPGHSPAVIRGQTCPYLHTEVTKLAARRCVTRWKRLSHVIFEILPVNGCFDCCCCSCCCFKTMTLCHSFSQGLNGSWPLTFHVPQQRWCLVDSQWKSRTKKGKVGGASVFLHGTGQGCDWHWLFDPPDPVQAQQHLTQCGAKGSGRVRQAWTCRPPVDAVVM